MARPDHQHGLLKWYNIKAGYGFITLQQSGKDVFVHATGLTRSLKENPPREGDRVILNLRQSDKGLDASDVAWSKPPTRLPMEKPPSSRKAGEEEDVPAKICACIYAAKAIAGSNLRRLPELIPILLQHNGLPVISIPLSVFSAPTRSKMRPTRRPVPRDHRREAQDEDDDVRSTNTPRPAATTREDEPPPAAVYRIVEPPEANARKVKPPPATANKIVRAATTRKVKPPPRRSLQDSTAIYISPRETSRIIPSSKALTRGGVG
ncbi:uncharacterized protein LOC123511122 [Portunus trituberculatus]|uniref:uncharacterized protein LOC123511122 n=1 Tax=Portunus trituberculatus TaxID=210409 RepID=UPI001E1CFB8D|nr:uncharacterized protein LOC123511122 [Portunus trituberculatus]